MENASKALLIAGGVFLAVMILSLVSYMATISGRMADEQNQRTELEQLTAFNKEYLAFNKKRMYGTDVITVVNKAINNNNSMLLNDVAEPYYINIIIRPAQTFTTTIYKIDNTEVSGDEEEVTSVSTLHPDVRTEFGITATPFNTFMQSGVDYSLGNWQGETFVTNSNFESFFNNSTTDKETVHGNYTYKYYSALTNFKRAIFKCTGFDYNPLTGRIEWMRFEQIDTFDSILNRGGH